MRRTIAILITGLSLLLWALVPSSAETPDGIVELSGGSLAAGIGYSWGSGTLIFQGQKYPLKVTGVALATVGASEYTAAGTVSGLKSPKDIDGVYTSVAAGATLGGGGTISAMRNQNGVTIQMTSTSAGLTLTLAAEGVKIALAN
jgi:hypothetical protein